MILLKAVMTSYDLNDWEKFKGLVSIELPEYEDVFITDDSSYLKYFRNLYVDTVEIKPRETTIQNFRSIWKNGYLDAKEFMEYLMNPVTIQPFSDYIEKKFVPMPVMDKEDYILTEDPIKGALLNGKKSMEQMTDAEKDLILYMGFDEGIIRLY